MDFNDFVLYIYLVILIYMLIHLFFIYQIDKKIENNLINSKDAIKYHIINSVILAVLYIIVISLTAIEFIINSQASYVLFMIFIFLLLMLPVVGSYVTKHSSILIETSVSLIYLYVMAGMGLFLILL